MFVVLRIANCLQETVVAVDPAAILRRASSFAFHTQRILCPGINGWATLKENLMFPGVTKVVFVLEDKPLASLGQNLADHDCGRVFALEALETIVEKLRIAVPLPF